MRRKATFGRWMSRMAAIAVLLASASAMAEETAPGPAGGPPDKAWAGGWKTGIEEGQPKDEVSGETMVVAAYGALWLILILFVLRAHAQVAALRRESAELRALIESRLPREGAGAAAGPS